MSCFNGGNISLPPFLIYKKEGFYQLVSINKREKEAIKENYPNAHIMRTVKQKSKRHHYYCEETSAVMAFLENFRSMEENET